MTGPPESCPVCGTALGSAGGLRCPGCGSVFGEEHRCPSCHAISAVRPKGAGFVCAACGAPRERGEGMVVLPSGGEGAAQGGALGLRLFGVLGVAGGVLAAAVAAMLVPGAFGVALAACVGGLGVGLGALSLRAASRLRAGLEQRERLRREAAIIELAAARGGMLTVTDVSRSLGVALADADQALTHMADGSRITVEVTPDGLIQYVFREVQSTSEVRARVAPDDEPEVVSDEMEREASSERGRNGS